MSYGETHNTVNNPESTISGVLLEKNPPIDAIKKFRDQVKFIEQNNRPSARLHFRRLREQSNQPDINEAIDDVLYAMDQLDITHDTKNQLETNKPKYLH